MVFKKSLLARAVFTRSVKVLDGSQEPQNPREQDFPKKKRPTFEIHRTSDASMGSVALSNLAYGLYGIYTSHIRVYRVN